MHKNGVRTQITPAVLIAHATLTADNTPTEIDLLGFNAATIMLYVGVGGITFTTTNKVEFKLSHGNTSGSLAAVNARHVAGLTSDVLTDGELTGGIIKKLVAAHATAGFYLFDYVGGARYINLLADFSGTHGTGTPISAFVLKASPSFTTVVPEAEIKTGRA